MVLARTPVAASLGVWAGTARSVDTAADPSAVLLSTTGCTLSVGVPSTVTAAAESVTASTLTGSPCASKKATGTTPSASSAAGGAVTVIWSGFSTATLPSAPPKRTVATASRFEPSSVTLVPPETASATVRRDGRTKDDPRRSKGSVCARWRSAARRLRRESKAASPAGRCGVGAWLSRATARAAATGGAVVTLGRRSGSGPRARELRGE